MNTQNTPREYSEYPCARTGVRYVLDIANTLRLDGVTCGDAPALKPAARPMRLGGILAEFFKLFCCCHYR